RKSMLKNRALLDVTIGGALVVVLSSVFVVDRLVSSSGPSAGGSGEQVVRKTGTLLGDDHVNVGSDEHIGVHIRALGSQERLEKLKVVRLTAKASFAGPTNVNDITLTWCWEPNIIMRFSEAHSD